VTCTQPVPQVQENSEEAPLQISVSAGVPSLVEICGEIDAYSAPGLRDELLRVMRHHGPRLALDLAGVAYIDCAGVSVLLATRRRAQLEDGSVEVIQASAGVRRLISLLNLGWAFGLASGSAM
jgi:anti-sigma B factor antagonist